MALLTSKDNKELILTCNCGCEEGLHVHAVVDDSNADLGYYTLSFINSNFTRDQEGIFSWYRLKKKLRKIWCVIRNRDYYYADIVMTKEEFKEFKEYLQGF